VNADFFSTANLLRLARRLFLIALAVVVLIEVVLWAFFRAPSQSTVTMKFRNQFPGLQEKISFEVNPRQQLRALNWTTGKKADGTVRILCVGGLGTIAQFQNAKDTWWGQLAGMIEEQLPGVKIEIGANATGGAYALHGAKWLATFAPDWQPDIIITNLGAGDASMQPLEYIYDENRLEKLPTPKRDRAAWKELLLKVSQMARWTSVRNEKRDALKQESAVGQENYYTEHFAKMRKEFAKLQTIPNPFRLSDADPRNEYRIALDTILTQSKSIGAQLLLTGEPTLCQEIMSEEADALRCTFMPKSAQEQNLIVKVAPGWVDRETRRFQEVAQELSEKQKVPFVDLNGEVPKDAQHFMNETMLTDLGAKEMAKKILPKALPLVQSVLGK
jgi:lysophospholipase L1-like esterase